MRAEVATARSLGISYRRFKGWEPATVYEYDDGGRLVSSRPDAEWDDTEQAWMLALDAWEREQCPLCGWPREICQAPSAEFDLEVPLPTRCHVTTAIKREQAGRREAGGSAHDDALLWGARLKGSAATASSASAQGPASR